MAVDLHRWTCRCGVSNVAVELAKAQQDGSDHAWDFHGIGASDAITFDVFTVAAQAKAVKATAEKEAALLGLTAAKLAKMRKPSPPPPPTVEESDELTALRLEISQLRQELAAAQQRTDRKVGRP